MTHTHTNTFKNNKRKERKRRNTEIKGKKSSSNCWKIQTIRLLFCRASISPNAICLYFLYSLVCSLFIGLYFCVPHFDFSLFENFFYLVFVIVIIVDVVFHFIRRVAINSTWLFELTLSFFSSLLLLMPSHCHMMFCRLLLTLSNGM